MKIFSIYMALSSKSTQSLLFYNFNRTQPKKQIQDFGFFDQQNQESVGNSDSGFSVRAA